MRQQFQWRSPDRQDPTAPPRPSTNAAPQDQLPRESSWSQLKQIPEAPQLASLNLEELQLLISNTESRYPLEWIPFIFVFFGQYPQVMNTEEGQNPADLSLCFHLYHNRWAEHPQPLCKPPVLFCDSSQKEVRRILPDLKSADRKQLQHEQQLNAEPKHVQPKYSTWPWGSKLRIVIFKRIECFIIACIKNVHASWLSRRRRITVSEGSSLKFAI